MIKTAVWAGLDYGEALTAICLIDASGVPVLECSCPSEAGQVAAVLQAPGKGDLTSVIIEGASPTPFIRALREHGLPVTVVDSLKASKLLGVRRNKTDTNDARGLAEIGRVGAAAKMPVFLRSVEHSAIRDQLIIRDQIVRQAASLRSCLRAMLRKWGSSVRTLPRGSRLRSLVEDELSAVEAQGALRKVALEMVTLNEHMVRFAAAMSWQLQCKAESIPQTRAFMAIPGVGHLTALAFYSLIEDPYRFQKAEDVAAYLGLVPRVKQSGTAVRRSGIGKCGDRFVRRSLVLAAQVLIGRRAAHTALRDWALTIASRSGHRTAMVAAARKLSVMMLSMWKSGRDFEPYPSATRV